ncbi:thiamine-binding protein [Kineococcus indalonis]|uniref:thiamine-binding protein n=1 Tax=Kineococcus indalonis TaxID=2696566 RepID=UPI0014121FFF|nr:thiamine-binding protein [Kineococcus indalonis]NAZ88732.1 thiamine-binding protein [Kineococcus indalonis]
MLVAFSVSPSGGPAPEGGAPDSVSAAVADAVLVVRSSGLPHRTDAMFTTVEGTWEQCMDVVRRACEAVGRHGPRVSLVLKADVRPGHEGELTGKLERLEAAVERAQGEAGRGQ